MHVLRLPERPRSVVVYLPQKEKEKRSWQCPNSAHCVCWLLPPYVAVWCDIPSSFKRWQMDPTDEDASSLRKTRVKLGEGIAGEVGRTGALVNLKDAHRDKLFNPAVDRSIGGHTTSLICCALKDSRTLFLSLSFLYVYACVYMCMCVSSHEGLLLWSKSNPHPSLSCGWVF